MALIGAPLSPLANIRVLSMERHIREKSFVILIPGADSIKLFLLRY